MVTTQQLESMSYQEIETFGQNELVDLSTVRVRQDLPEAEKIMDYLQKIKNPYCFLCGETPVRICFADNGVGLEKTLENYFIRMKQN